MASRNCINSYIPKYFMAVKKCINIHIPKYFWTSRGSLYDLVAWNEPLIHFAIVQLVRDVTEIGENSTPS